MTLVSRLRSSVAGLRGRGFDEVARHRGRIGPLPVPANATEGEVLDVLYDAMTEIVAAGGYKAIAAVRVAATVPITGTGEQTIDGVPVVAGDRVLATAQTSGQDNGIYVVAAGAWTRATDFDSSGEVLTGSMVPVLEGGNAGAFLLMTTGTITVGTTPQLWRQVRYNSASKIKVRQAVAAAITRSMQDEARDSFTITQFGANPSNSAAENSVAINAAIAAAMEGPRSLYIPHGTFDFDQLDFVGNGDASPKRLYLHGPGTLRSTYSGFAFTSSEDYFYDLVLGGVRFESVAGSGTKLIDGDKFIRIIIAPGSQFLGFDWVIYSTAYLQSIKVNCVIMRGGFGAFIKARMAYDVDVSGSILEFGTDGIVIDGSTADPAAHTVSIRSNTIEGMGGRGIVFGACLSVGITGNYMEGNTGGEIFLNAGTTFHKSLRVQDNSLQQSAARVSAGAYSIVWGASTALPVRSGGNYCTGHLHDTQDVSASIDMDGDSVELGRNLFRPNVGRYKLTDDLRHVWGYFARRIALNPFYQEITFEGKHGTSTVGPAITFGTNSPANDPDQFERKAWARGSIVVNAQPTAGGVSFWQCLTAGTPGTWSYTGLIPEE